MLRYQDAWHSSFLHLVHSHSELSFSPYLTSQEKALFEKRTVCCQAELSILLPIQRQGNQPYRTRSTHHGPHVASTDVENGPGAEAGGGQIQDGLRDFLRFAQPGQRHTPLRQFLLLCH